MGAEDDKAAKEAAERKRQEEEAARLAAEAKAKADAEAEAARLAAEKAKRASEAAVGADTGPVVVQKKEKKKPFRMTRSLPFLACSLGAAPGYPTKNFPDRK